MTDVPTFDPPAFRGRVELRSFTSELLQDNPLGDPATRSVPVYVPPGAHADLPVIFVLAGFTGRGHKYLETHPWHAGPVVAYDRLVAAEQAPPAILVLPDCFTRLGGSQYVDSSAVGAYRSHLVRELVPWVDAHYPTDPAARGVVGKSSGGFGALWLGMQHPDLFGRVASISGDCGFDALFPAEIHACLRGLVAYDGSPATFLERFFESPDLSGDGHAIINTLAMAACYAPNPASPLGFDLPFDLETGELIDAVWQRFLAFDPIVAAREHRDSLASLETLHLECGLRDEFHLQWGARRLSRTWRELGIEHEHVEHPGSHRGIDSRFPPLFAKLAGRGERRR